MGKVQIRYYKVRRNGRAFWEPTQAMKAYGFVSTPCGQDGPAAWAIAEELNRRWQEARRNKKPEPAAAPPVLGHLKVYKSKSLGEAFQTYRLTTEWARKAPRTREDWERGWKRIEPLFGDHPPSTVDLAIISEWREAIEKKYGLREAHRAMKIWRALWKVAAAMRTRRSPSATPSRRAASRPGPRARQCAWSSARSAWAISVSQARSPACGMARCRPSTPAR
jgi:hypothetical protein